MNKHLIQDLKIPEEEYKKKEQEWIEQLKKQVKKDRSIILNHIKRTFHIKTSQEQLRSLSWTHSFHLMSDESYKVLVEPFFLGFTLPLLAASSPQDAYHLMHFTQASLLSIHRPGVTEFQTEVLGEGVQWIQATEDEAYRWENRQVLIQSLKEMIPAQDHTPRLTLKDLYREILEIKRLIQEGK